MAEYRDAPLLERIGGEEGCWRLSRAFYEHVAHDPLLRPLFGKSQSFRCAIESLSTFMIQALGGPARFSERRARPVIRGFHKQLRITPALRDAWIADMQAALTDLGTAGEDRATLLQFLSRTASFLTDDPSGAAAQQSDASLDPEAEALWEAYCATEALLEAIDACDVELALSLTRSVPLAPRLDGGGPFLVGILGAMGTSGNEAMLAYTRGRLERQPELVHDRHAYGTTLLYDAAASWCVPFIEILLSCGADPNAGDRSPLDGAANVLGRGMDAHAGVQVVKALIAAGADVNARGGVKSCTALHMAARRGNLGIARTLLDAGAEVDPRDACGDTPLRRAVNCGHPEVARLLLSRGADPHSVGSGGLTPATAARRETMRAIFTRESGVQAARERTS